MSIIDYEDFLKERRSILIDVRSPKEFEEEPIPGAINIPLLNNEERAEIGTIYKQVSAEAAKKAGIEVISRKLPELFNQVNELSKNYYKLVFYCARGGMRSGTVASLFSSLGYKANKLNGGYKQYRKYLLDQMPIENAGIEYIVLHGRTGIGKTKVLNRLEEKGYGVLDLEKFADHKGSFYGGLCETRKQSQKRFESELLEYIRTTDTKYFVVESESKRIGDLYVPDCIFAAMKAGRHVLLETSIEHRVEIIMEDYAKADVDEMLKCTNRLHRYLKKEEVERYENMLKEKKFAEFSRSIMEDYYDPLYQKSIDKYDFKDIISYEDLDVATEKVIEYLEVEGFVEKPSEEIEKVMDVVVEESK